jgi:hypothetical protein
MFFINFLLLRCYWRLLYRQKKNTLGVRVQETRKQGGSKGGEARGKQGDVLFASFLLLSGRDKVPVPLFL